MKTIFMSQMQKPVNSAEKFCRTLFFLLFKRHDDWLEHIFPINREIFDQKFAFDCKSIKKISIFYEKQIGNSIKLQFYKEYWKTFFFIPFYSK